MSDFNLDAFLAAQQAEGVSDGVGDFTISHTKAAQKLTQFSLPREESWVLKVLQAAAGWNFRSLTLSQSRTVSTFHFEMDDPSLLPGNDTLVSALLRADFQSVKPIDRLGTGLRVLVERSHLSFLILSARGETESQAIYAGVYFGDMDDEDRVKFRAKWKPGLTLAVHHIEHTETNRLLLNLIPIRKFALPTLLELERYGSFSPLRLTVGGRRIDGPFRSSLMKWSTYKKPLLLAAVAPRGEEAVLKLSEEFTSARFTLETSAGRALRKLTPSPPAAAYFLLAAENRKGWDQDLPKTAVIWIEDGVIVQEDLIKVVGPRSHLTIVANARGLSKDLTGFQLIQNAQYYERRGRLLKRVEEGLGEWAEEGYDLLAEDLDEHSPQDRRKAFVEARAAQRKKGAKIFASSLVVSPVMGAAAPVTMAVGAASGIVTAFKHTRLEKGGWEVEFVVEFFKEVEAVRKALRDQSEADLAAEN